MRRFSHLLILPAALTVMMGTPVWADHENADPGLGVARVSLTNGDISLRRGDSGDWIEARLNTPLVAGDSIATGHASRAEVQLDHSNFLRLSEDSEILLAELERHRFQVQVVEGLVTYVALRGDEADIEIQTADVAVRPLESGTYRIEVFENNETEVTVRDGEAEVSSREGSELLNEGRAMIVRTDPADGSVKFQIAKAPARDDWDRWNKERNRELKQSASYHRVGRDIYGVEVLDTHGRWVYIPRYGYCWSPYVSAGWAPYRYGRWMWLDYYGWTWASYEPWGWAPYHYGRWYHHARFGWVWYPRHHHARHYWRPALVAFFGYGSHSGFQFGVSFGYGHIGWVPLGPGDTYYPWYGRRHRRGHPHRSRRRHTNVHVDVDVYNVYQNARVRGGVTVLDARDFSRGRLRNARSLQRAELRRARLIQGQVPVVPARETLGRAVRKAEQRRHGRDASRPRTFHSTRSRPNRIRRVPFEQQQREIAEMISSRNEEQRRSRPTGTATGTAERSASRRGRPNGERSHGVRATEPPRTAERRNRREARDAKGWKPFRRNAGASSSSEPGRSFTRGTGRTPGPAHNPPTQSRRVGREPAARHKDVGSSGRLPGADPRPARSRVRQERNRRSEPQRVSPPASRAAPHSASRNRPTTRARSAGPRPRPAPRRTQRSQTRQSKRPVARSSDRGSDKKPAARGDRGGRSSSPRKRGRP